MIFLHKSNKVSGFSFPDVCVAILVCALFGIAVFATNQRLLLSLKSQKETTAAAMVMQWRMENFRATAFSDIATKDYVKNNILKVRTASIVDANGNSITVDPFGPLSDTIVEQFTIGVYPDDGSTKTVLSWDNQHTAGQDISVNNNLDAASMLKVDVLETWTSADGRQRQRQLSTVVTLGNVGI